MNHECVSRLHVEEGPRIRNRHAKRKVSAKPREERKAPEAPKEVWSVDFLSDQHLVGSGIRIPTIVDACPKLSPAIDVRQQNRGHPLAGRHRQSGPAAARHAALALGFGGIAWGIAFGAFRRSKGPMGHFAAVRESKGLPVGERASGPVTRGLRELAAR